MGICGWHNYRSCTCFCVAVLTLALSAKSVPAEVITKFDTKIKAVVLTFDACETKTPSYFDKKILNYLVNNKIPATFFIGGKFALRNIDKIKEISNYDFIGIENHSFDHLLHMEKLDSKKISEDILKTDNLLKKITGKSTKFFRFPGGNYDKNALDTVEKSGFKVIHWSFPSGDPDKNMTAEKITEVVKRKTRPGSILIFHINGRGYHTAEALPEIMNFLNSNGYKILRLQDIVK